MEGTRVCRAVCFFALIATGVAIDCYKCTSIDGANQACEDPFKQDLSTYALIARNCEYGYFGGTHCIKLKGIREDGTQILVRQCADADWGKDCGDIRFLYDGEEEEHIQGCLTTCMFDGCNAAPARLALSPLLLTAAVVLAILCTLRHHHHQVFPLF